MMTPLGIAAAGIYDAAARFEVSAKRTLEPGIDPRAIEPVEQSIAKQQFSANAATVRTADQMLGRLIDLKI